MNQDNKVFEASDFDAWSKSYEKSIQQQDSYPFAAYDEVVSEVIRQVSGKKILDLGFGTGVVTSQLYDLGYEIIGYDFSEEMVKIAQEKMPEAQLNVFDFSESLPEFIDYYDSVVMTYVIHHFSIERQVEIIRELLKVCGKIVIGDVMTLTRAEMDWAKEKDEQFWDNSETYLVVEEIQDIFFDKVITFEKKSYISGVITINN